MTTLNQELWSNVQNWFPRTARNLFQLTIRKPFHFLWIAFKRPPSMTCPLLTSPTSLYTIRPSLILQSHWPPSYFSCKTNSSESLGLECASLSQFFLWLLIPDLCNSAVKCHILSNPFPGHKSKWTVPIVSLKFLLPSFRA